MVSERFLPYLKAYIKTQSGIESSWNGEDHSYMSRVQLQEIVQPADDHDGEIRCPRCNYHGVRVSEEWFGEYFCHLILQGQRTDDFWSELHTGR